MMPDLEIAPADVKKMMDNREDFILLDVRELWEHETAHIEGSTLIPLNDLPDRLARLPKDKLIVTQCHHGSRSLSAARYLRSYGYNAKSMKGGIEEWSRTVDKKVPTY